MIRNPAILIKSAVQDHLEGIHAIFSGGTAIILDLTSRSSSSLNNYDTIAVSSNPLRMDNRRDALLLITTMIGSVGILGALPSPANAASGAEAKIELPNPLQQMTDRVSRQCLVESLGNRECLVFVDDADKFLYQGADATVVRQRLEKSIKALASIPEYVTNKQWSKITGVLTGPMGDLLQTLNQVVSMSSNMDVNNAAIQQQSIKNIKLDLYAMNDAVIRKDSQAILKYHVAATNDLVAFVKALS